MRMLTAAPLGCPCTTSGTTWAGSRWPASDCRPGGTALELRAALQTQHPIPQRQAHCHRHAAHTLWHGSSKPPACTQVTGGTTTTAYQHKSSWSRLGISLATPSKKLPNSIWIRECVVQLPAKVHKLLASSLVGHTPGGRGGGGIFPRQLRRFRQPVLQKMQSNLPCAQFFVDLPVWRCCTDSNVVHLIRKSARSDKVAALKSAEMPLLFRNCLKSSSIRSQAVDMMQLIETLTGK